MLITPNHLRTGPTISPADTQRLGANEAGFLEELMVGVLKSVEGGGLDRLDSRVLTETGAFIKARLREQDTRNGCSQSDRAYKESR